MSLSIRRLGPGDEAVIDTLAREDADFDVAGRGAPLRKLTADAAAAYLADPDVMHWIAEDGGRVVGHLYCHVLRKRAGDPIEVLLYEIGVRRAERRKQIGRALVDTMHGWMKDQGIRESWVLADNPGAVSFYRACGYSIGAPAPVYLLRPTPAKKPAPAGRAKRGS
jgi:GNAT superfamily N-acetyltransferase